MDKNKKYIKLYTHSTLVEDRFSFHIENRMGIYPSVWYKGVSEKFLEGDQIQWLKKAEGYNSGSMFITTKMRIFVKGKQGMINSHLKSHLNLLHSHISSA